MQPTFYTYRNITAATTTTIKARGLYKIQFSNAHAGIITLYDSATASGNLIATIPSATAASSYVFEAALTSGFLTIVTASTTDMTVMYQ